MTIGPSMLLVSSTLGSTPPAPITRPGLLRPVAIAGLLWLLIAGLLGLVVVYVLLAAPVIAIFYAIPVVLSAALGIGLISRRGIGLPLVSMVLGTVLATLGLLGVLGLNGAGTDNTGAVMTAAYGGAIAVSSVVGVWSTRMTPRGLREGGPKKGSTRRCS